MCSFDSCEQRLVGDSAVGHKRFTKGNHQTGGTIITFVNHKPTKTSYWSPTVDHVHPSNPLQVLNPLLSQSQLSHSLQARLASCRILGKVACKFDSQM